MRIALCAFAVLLLFAAPMLVAADGYLGVDIAVWDHYSLSQWQCFNKAGYSFAVRNSMLDQQY